MAGERRRSSEVVGKSSARLTRPLLEEQPREQGGRRRKACCLTALQFRKLYPADLTVTLTTLAGRTVTRKFTAAKLTRTAFIKASGDDEDGDDATTAVRGGLGPCVDVDVSLVDTSTATLVVAHYHFVLCCNDPQVRQGSRLTHKEPPVILGGQIVTLPLLQITGVQSDPCP